MKVLKFLLPVLVLAVGAGGYYYFKQGKVDPEPISKPTRLPVVSALVVKKQSVAPKTTIFGQVEAPANSTLTAAIAADVFEVSVLEGDAVSSGDLLVRLDDTDVALELLQRGAEIAEIEAQLESDRKRYDADRASLAREKALLALSQKSVERNRALAQSNAGTQATLDNARQQEEQQKLAITQRQLNIEDFSSRQKLWNARLEKSKALYEKTKRDQKRSEVRAPFDGRIVKVMVSAGDRTAPGAQLVQLYEDGNLEVRAQIPSRYLYQLQQSMDQGQSIRAVTNNNGSQIELTLTRLSASVQQGQGGVDGFFNTDAQRLPALGSTISMQLTLPPISNVIVLPPDALYGADRIYTISDGQLSARKVVRLGQTVDASGRQLLVISGEGLSDGDYILSSRLPQAIDGLMVQVADSDSGG